MRIGFGYDVHRLVEGRQLIIGGVNIPWKLGLLGHSDADVLAHAVIDSILGALGRGDIGRHFPDNDPANKGRDSFDMLREVMSMVKQDMFSVNNIDITVVAQEPKLSPYANKMEENLSMVLDVDQSKVNVKATTTEGMGYAGREEGMEAYAVVSLIKEV